METRNYDETQIDAQPPRRAHDAGNRQRDLFFTDMPDGDYVELKREFGEVTTEMVEAYRDGYNG